MRTLIGLLTSNHALLQLEAARCLHELSHSEQSVVAEACLPATSYLLTYLSGHSSDFIVSPVSSYFILDLYFKVRLWNLLCAGRFGEENDSPDHTAILTPVIPTPFSLAQFFCCPSFRSSAYIHWATWLWRVRL